MRAESPLDEMESLAREAAGAFTGLELESEAGEANSFLGDILLTSRTGRAQPTSSPRGGPGASSAEGVLAPWWRGRGDDPCDRERRSRLLPRATGRSRGGGPHSRTRKDALGPWSHHAPGDGQWRGRRRGPVDVDRRSRSTRSRGENPADRLLPVHLMGRSLRCSLPFVLAFASRSTRPAPQTFPMTSRPCCIIGSQRNPPTSTLSRRGPVRPSSEFSCHRAESSYSRRPSVTSRSTTPSTSLVPTPTSWRPGPTGLSDSGATRDANLLVQVIDDLNSALGDPVARLLEECQVRLQSRVTLEGTSGLASLPIHACGRQPLLSLFDLEVHPSVLVMESLECLNGDRHAKSDRPLQVVDTQGDLPFTRVEVALGRRLVGQVRALVGRDARKETVVRELRRVLGRTSPATRSSSLKHPGRRISYFPTNRCSLPICCRWTCRE